MYFCSVSLKSYISYRRKRVNAQGIHSPFVFEFYNEVLKKAHLINENQIENLRKRLVRNKAKIEISDYGAGSKRTDSDVRTISNIARHSSVNAKFGKLLKRIVDYYKVENILELGTSLGIGASYMASSKECKSIQSIEGCPNIAELAKDSFRQLNLKVESHTGEFSDLLPKVLQSQRKYDLIYIDGNHQYNPTIEYFETLIDCVDNDGFIVFDDIHWSEEMEKAWDYIASSDKVNVSIDLFRMGIVVKKEGQAKQHFVLKY